MVRLSKIPEMIAHKRKEYSWFGKSVQPEICRVQEVEPSAYQREQPQRGNTPEKPQTLQNQ